MLLLIPFRWFLSPLFSYYFCIKYEVVFTQPIRRLKRFVGLLVFRALFRDNAFYYPALVLTASRSIAEFNHLRESCYTKGLFSTHDFNGLKA